MRKFLRWLGYGVAAAVLIALLFAAWLWFASGRVLGRVHEAAPERLAAPDGAQLADAGRQARILGCANCHGARLQGALMFDGGPFAKVFAPNLTALAARASDQQLAQAIRQGIGHDGRALFLMPSEQYSRLSDRETAALIAHIRGAPRSGGAVPAIEWGPIGRYALATGGLRPVLASLEDYRVRQPYDTGPGEAVGGGGAPPDLAVAGAYDLAQFRTLMRTGRPPDGRDLGLMKEVAERGFSSFSDEEVEQLYAYLRARAERVAR